MVEEWVGAPLRPAAPLLAAAPHFDVQAPLVAEGQVHGAGGILAGTGRQHACCPGQRLPIAFDQLGNMQAANKLLTLAHKHEIDRQGAPHLLNCVDGIEECHEPALVGGTAPVQHLGEVGMRRYDPVEGIVGPARAHDVGVEKPVHRQGLGGAGIQMGPDARQLRCLGNLHLLASNLQESFGEQFGALPYAQIAFADTGLGHVGPDPFQMVRKRLPDMGVEIGIDG